MSFRKIPLSLSQLSLAAVLQCGQSFRWSIFPLAASEGQADSEAAQPIHPSHEYRFCLRDRVICLRQSQEALLWNAVFPTAPTSPEETAQRDAETLEWINDYFQLNVDLEKLYRMWSERDPIFHGLQGRFTGIRMLRQDPWENLISYAVFISCLPPCDDDRVVSFSNASDLFALLIITFRESRRWSNLSAQTTLLRFSPSIRHQDPGIQSYTTHSHLHRFLLLQKWPPNFVHLGLAIERISFRRQPRCWWSVTLDLPRPSSRTRSMLGLNPRRRG